MEEFAIIGIGGAMFVGLLVEGVKRLFPKVVEDTRLVLAIALVLGVVLSVLAYLAEIVPGFETWLGVIASGLVAGFTAMGLYDTVKTARG
ncbi:MAG: hypothetical protein BWY76_02494 [bacterium ADurb.Bin429]|nr:MAG: hypothetical protein BWY76_02494 [bacterium ADurb.Bin429]